MSVCHADLVDVVVGIEVTERILDEGEQRSSGGYFAIFHC